MLIMLLTFIVFREGTGTLVMLPQAPTVAAVPLIPNYPYGHNLVNCSFANCSVLRKLNAHHWHGIAAFKFSSIIFRQAVHQVLKHCCFHSDLLLERNKQTNKHKTYLFQYMCCFIHDKSVVPSISFQNIFHNVLSLYGILGMILRQDVQHSIIDETIPLLAWQFGSLRRLGSHSLSTNKKEIIWYISFKWAHSLHGMWSSFNK
jgi:hypothetical protein